MLAFNRISAPLAGESVEVRRQTGNGISDYRKLVLQFAGDSPWTIPGHCGTNLAAWIGV
jgi:hypothetical protein